MSLERETTDPAGGLGDAIPRMLGAGRPRSGTSFAMVIILNQVTKREKETQKTGLGTAAELRYIPSCLDCRTFQCTYHHNISIYHQLPNSSPFPDGMWFPITELPRKAGEVSITQLFVWNHLNIFRIASSRPLSPLEAAVVLQSPTLNI